MFKAPTHRYFPKLKATSSSLSSLKPSNMETDEPPTHSRPRSKLHHRTNENFLQFCNLILKYENYEAMKKEEQDRRRHSSSPLGSTGSSESSSEGCYNSKEDNSVLDFHVSSDLKSPNTDEDVDSMNQITCYCRKPFAGRPMIECSTCLTWIHLKCARLRRGNIPDTWNCTKCQTRKRGGVSNNKMKVTGRQVPKTKRLKNKRISIAKKSPTKVINSGEEEEVEDLSVPHHKSQKRKIQTPAKNAGDPLVLSSVS